MAVFCVTAAVLHAVLDENTLGIDYYVFWLAGRSLFIDHASPYHPALTLQSQLGIYQRPALAGEDPMVFAYPLYSLFLLLPVVGLSFDWAFSLWLAFNVLFWISVVVFAFPWAPRWMQLSTLLLYPFTFGLILGNFVVLAGALLILFYGLFNRRARPSPLAQAALGVMLAWTTSKPQFIWLYLLIILLYAVHSRLWALAGGFVGGMAAFVSASFWLMLGWIPAWLARLGVYAGHLGGAPNLTRWLQAALPPPASWLLTLLLWLAGIAVTVWLFKLWQAGRQPAALLFAWAGFATYLFHPRSVSYEQLAFALPLLFWCVEERQAPHWAQPALWLGLLGLYWAVFFVSLSPGAGGAQWLAELPFGYYLIWFLGYAFTRLTGQRRWQNPAGV